jgi:mono/diheme cytochrome c family protein
VSPDGAGRARTLAASIVTAAALALAFASLVAWPDASDKPRPASPKEFPAGDGQAIADRSCRTCHSPMLVTQQAKDSTGWEKTLGQMEKWGVKLTPAEHDTLRGYLLGHYGPRKLPVAKAVSPRPDSAKRASSASGTSP